MYVDKQAFVDEVRREYATIKGQNIWAKKYFEQEMPSDSGLHQAEVSAQRCWALYTASRDNALGFLLLGEVSMRSKIALVQNFGLNSAFGHEDDEPWLSPWLGSEIKNPLEAQAHLSNIDPATLDARKHAHLGGLQGPGSILSDRLWTPLMNDAWLLGGVHKEQSFHLVTEGLGEQKLVAAMDALRDQALLEQTRADPGASPTSNNATLQVLVQEVWRQWFVDNPQYLYESWGPRVLTRELLGLMSFGYQPMFTRQELGFRCTDARRAADATISAYSDALDRLGLHKGNDPAARSAVLQALSAWLFARDDVLK
ncbi:hypothetical protein WKW80_22760 [Variovorax humicola]|uniref:Uncharacterized protein n=1 Tax=Variovorax humicola TaxID=1769758 RepID=A0ABU8W429_9BURK